MPQTNPLPPQTADQPDATALVYVGTDLHHLCLWRFSVIVTDAEKLFGENYNDHHHHLPPWRSRRCQLTEQSINRGRREDEPHD
jgi:hypothetical protein